MKSLPDHVSAYKKTDIFTETSIPKALLHDHRTMADVWGKIIVLEGRLLYTIKTVPDETVELSKNYDGIVEPQVTHFVEPQGKVKFYVEFYK